MEVILLDNIGKLGGLGDKVTVKPGYGRNYLVPYGLAVPATKENVEAFQPHVDKLHTLLTQIEQGGPEKAKQRQKDQGKLLVRERIAKLVDGGDQFLELSQLAGHELYEDAVPAGGVITGLGTVNNQLCMY